MSNGTSWRFEMPDEDTKNFNATTLQMFRDNFNSTANRNNNASMRGYAIDQEALIKKALMQQAIMYASPYGQLSQMPQQYNVQSYNSIPQMTQGMQPLPSYMHYSPMGEQQQPMFSNNTYSYAAEPSRFQRMSQATSPFGSQLPFVMHSQQQHQQPQYYQQLQLYQQHQQHQYENEHQPPQPQLQLEQQQEQPVEESNSVTDVQLCYQEQQQPMQQQQQYTVQHALQHAIQQQKQHTMQEQQLMQHELQHRMQQQQQQQHELQRQEERQQHMQQQPHKPEELQLPEQHHMQQLMHQQMQQKKQQHQQQQQRMSQMYMNGYRNSGGYNYGYNPFPMLPSMPIAYLHPTSCKTLNRINSVSSFENNKSAHIRNSLQDLLEYQRVAAHIIQKTRTDVSSTDFNASQDNYQLQRRALRVTAPVTPGNGDDTRSIGSTALSFIKRLGHLIRPENGYNLFLKRRKDAARNTTAEPGPKKSKPHLHNNSSLSEDATKQMLCGKEERKSEISKSEMLLVLEKGPFTTQRKTKRLTIFRDRI